MVMPPVNTPGIRKANNQGLVATNVAGNDLLHTISVGRTVRICKIFAWNDTGGAVDLQFGTNTNVPAFVQLFPDMRALNNIENIWWEMDLPWVIFAIDTRAGAAGRTGDIRLNTNPLTANIDIILEVEEYGA